MKNDLYIDLVHLRNDQHYQFFYDFGTTVTFFKPAELKIVPLFNEFTACFTVEDASFKLISKSNITAKIKAADKRRDDVFRGLSLTCHGAALHPRAEVREAATALIVVFDTYGNIARKPLSEKTSAAMNLAQELREKHASAVNTAGLKEWVEALATDNAQCFQLMQERWDEQAAQTGSVSMKQAREAVDTCYAAIMKRILALKEVEGADIYDSFLARLGVAIDSYNAIIAHRRVKGAKNGGDAGAQTSGKA